MRLSNDTDQDNVYHISHRREMFYSLILMISAVLTEIHSFLAARFPELTKGEGVKKDLFLSPGFKMNIDVLWYVKMVFDNLFLIVVLYIIAQISGIFSKKLFYVACVFLLYNIIDFFSFLWNFKTSTGMYWVLILAASISTLLIIFYKKKMKAV